MNYVQCYKSRSDTKKHLSDIFRFLSEPMSSGNGDKRDAAISAKINAV